MRTNENNKQLLIYNRNHHYDILNMISEFITKQFNDTNILDYIQVFDSKEEIINYFFEKNSILKNRYNVPY